MVGVTGTMWAQRGAFIVPRTTLLTHFSPDSRVSVSSLCPSHFQVLLTCKEERESVDACAQIIFRYFLLVRKSVKVWTPESEEQLRGCFECTEWSVLVDSCENVSEAADVVSSYIGFCEDMLFSAKIVKVFPNNKTWISRSIKSTLNEKKIAFQTGDRAERKRVQAKLTRELREGKREYRAKVEKQFQTGNMADAWDGLKTLTGEKKNKSRGSHMTTEQQVKFSNELNDFYCRFERDDLGEDINSVVLELKEKISECEE